MRPRASLLPADDELPSSAPQHTPGAEAALDSIHRAVNSATLDLIRSAATTPVQLAQLAGSVEGLRMELRERDARLEAALGHQQMALQELVTLSRQRLELDRQAHDAAAVAAQRAHEAALEGARWWRSLAEPRTVGLILLAVALWLLGQGALIPGLLGQRSPP